MTPAVIAVSPLRGEVYWLNFDPATGTEMKSIHPCIVVQIDLANQRSSLTIVVAVTKNPRVANLRVGVFIPAGTGGLTKDCAAHCGHVYTVDRMRLGAKFGNLPAPLMSQIDQALVLSLGL